MRRGLHSKYKQRARLPVVGFLKRIRVCGKCLAGTASVAGSAKT